MEKRDEIKDLLTSYSINPTEAPQDDWEQILIRVEREKKHTKKKYITSGFLGATAAAALAVLLLYPKRTHQPSRPSQTDSKVIVAQSVNYFANSGSTKRMISMAFLD